MKQLKIYLDSPPDALGFAPLPASAAPRHLATFHSGFPYSLAAERLQKQAAATGWFGGVEIFHPGSSLPVMQAFLSQHGEFVRRNPRGYGCWRWKPLLVQAMLAALPEGAHFYYMDAGCELSALGAARFASLDRELDARGILCFEIAFPELGWSKREAVDAVFGGWHDEAMQSPQIQATWFGLRNTPAVREIIAEWAHWAVQGDLIADDFDAKRQHALFRKHRHDQALWSLLMKKRGIKPLPQEDCFEKWLYVRDSWVLLAPVHGLRSRGRRSRVDAVARLSSATTCLQNLRSPSPLFRARLASMRLRVRLLDALRRTRDRLKSAALSKPSQSTGAHSS